MPITPPRLDDRNYQDLVDELLARVPAHTPEWTPAQVGDPGRTLLELFAWLADTVLYRANLVPERQRLAFLQLLGERVQAARAAHGVVSLAFDETNPVTAVKLASEARLPAPATFESLSEVTVMPVSSECYYKRLLSTGEQNELSDVIEGLRAFHGIEGNVEAYVTTPVFVDGLALRPGIDVAQDTADRSLWVALLAGRAEDVSAVREALAGGGEGAQLLNVGMAPAIELPAGIEANTRPGRLDHSWSISTAQLLEDQPVYNPLQRVSDTTVDFTRRGVERLVLPAGVEDFGVLEGDARKDANAGLGDRPPRLDDPERLARLVAWLRLQPAPHVGSMRLGWLGINAMEIDQRQTLRGRVIGQSNGAADQVFSLNALSIEAGSFELVVEETGRGYVAWQATDDLAINDRDDAVYRLDSEAGTVQFGNGIFGRIPAVGARIRVALMRAGGGVAGNLGAGTLQEIQANQFDGSAVTRKLKVIQGLPTDGGADAETLDTAERRIPARLQHRNRAVCEDDYHALVLETPGTRIGRVEVLPRFMPRQRRFNVPGVVSVMILPEKPSLQTPHPRPDQPLIEKVHDYLSPRRPLATELYVIGCEYVPLALAAGVTVKAGYGHDQVTHAIRLALQEHLAPLPPHGPAAEGWPLGRSVQDRELEVVIARVKGVATVTGVNLFRRANQLWQQLPRVQRCDPLEITLQAWQLPELLATIVSTDGSIPENIAAGPVLPGESTPSIALPVVPEVC